MVGCSATLDLGIDTACIGLFARTATVIGYAHRFADITDAGGIESGALANALVVTYGWRFVAVTVCNDEAAVGA